MPLYEYQCSHCQDPFSERRAVEGRDKERACRWCGFGTVRRIFTPTTQIRIPSEFHATRGWYLPPKDSPKWQNMVREGSEKSQVKEASFKEFLKDQGSSGRL